MALFFAGRQKRSKTLDRFPSTHREPRSPPRFHKLIFAVGFPFLLLTVFGIWALRQDWIAVQQTLRQQADELAQELAQEMQSAVQSHWHRLNQAEAAWLRILQFCDRLSTNASLSSTLQNLRLPPEAITTNLPFPIHVQLNSTGALVRIPSLRSYLSPPQWLTQLDPRQQLLWESADRLFLSGTSSLSCRKAFQSFLATHPPQEAVEVARFRLTLLDLEKLPPSQRITHLLYWTHATNTALPSGIPVGTIALVRALQEARSGGFPLPLLQALCRYCRTAPDRLAPQILHLARQAIPSTNSTYRSILHALETWWTGTQRVRFLTDSLRNTLRSSLTPTNLWLHAFGQNWLVQIQQLPSTSSTRSSAPLYQAGFYPKPLLQSWVLPVWEKRSRKIPRFFSVQIRLAGQSLLNSESHSVPKTPLAQSALPVFSAQAFHSVPSSTQSSTLSPTAISLTAQVFLIHPQAAFQQARRRTLLFGTLLVFVMVIGTLALVQTHRALTHLTELNRMQTDFISSVSHELRTPVAAVRLLAENLLSTRVTDTEKKHHYLQLIVQECRLLGNLINNILEFARIEQGRKEYEKEPTDLTELVRQTVTLMQPIAERKQIRMQTHLPDKPLIAMVDPEALQQALRNLLDNAVKFSPPGKPVEVGLALEPSPSTASSTNTSEANPKKPRPHILLWVQDQGPGIPKEEHDRIFHRFYRAGHPLRRQTKGLGIGLSLVRHIVRAHQGWIELDSKPGQGSRFTIHLPWQPLQSGP